MKFRIIVTLLIFSGALCFGQNKTSQGDIYFYQYKYAKAIQSYVKEKKRWPLSLEQRLKLADSYFKEKDYKNAALYYINVNKENDSILSSHRINSMLQSIAKNGQKERVKAFLESKSHLLSSELLENYRFNKEVLSLNQQNQDFSVSNLMINTAAADLSPAFYKNQLLFSSTRKSTLKKSKKFGYLNVFVASINKEGKPYNAETFSKLPEFSFHESTPFYSEDLNKLFIIRSNTNGAEMAFNDEGKNALAIGALDASNSFQFLLKDLSNSFYYPFFEEKNDRLYFAANLEDGYGGTDLYYVQTNNGQIMSEPVNLGPKINTPANEIAPYILNGSLYYSSDIFYGLGGMDIYKSNLKKNNEYSIPVNLGKGINSTQDDFGFIIKLNPDNGYSGYFSSNRQGGKGDDDIYSFSVNNSIGLKTLAIEGSVVSFSKRTSVDNAKVTISNSEGAVIKELYTSNDGKYSLEIPWFDQVTIQVTKNGYSTFYQTYKKGSLEAIQNAPLAIEIGALADLVEEKEGKTVLKLNKFYFNRGKSIVTPLIASELDKAVKAIQSFPQLKLRIETHTASKGWDSTNKKLSQKRADAINAYLQQKGISSANIIAVIGYGEEQLKNKCANGVYCLDFLHKQNIRTLLVITNYDSIK